MAILWLFSQALTFVHQCTTCTTIRVLCCFLRTFSSNVTPTNKYIIKIKGILILQGITCPTAKQLCVPRSWIKRFLGEFVEKSWKRSAVFHACSSYPVPVPEMREGHIYLKV